MTLKTHALSAAVFAGVAMAQSPLAHAAPAIRPPAVPLVTTDPYFSIWSFDETLTAKQTTHWTGKQQKLTSLIRIDGVAYRLMGDAPSDFAALKQTAVVVRPTQSIYTFEDQGVVVTLTFTTPLLPDDLKILARPTSYVTWSVKSSDGKPHETAVYVDAAAELAVDRGAEHEGRPAQKSIASRLEIGKRSALAVGSEEQDVLSGSGDDRRIDWGHFYLIADEGESSASISAAADARKAFAAGQPLPADAGLEATAADAAPILGVALPLGKVNETALTRHVTLAYDDEISIKYFREKLKPYWRVEMKSAAELLEAAEKDYSSLMARCETFDAELTADLKQIGGDSYVQIGSLSYRQALAAQKICADANGQPLSFSKENFSNGCIATVDVLYPASPQMMVFSPSLLKASLVPLLDYSMTPLWKDDCAPHDLGQYPLAIGQVYGGGAKSPMPVEETGNMLIMVAALAKIEGNADFAVKYWPTLTLWNNYLKKNGLDPENQLCTDDFAGHIARNSNLSAKAIMGIAAYGQLAQMLGKDADAKAAMNTARDYARKWMALGEDGDHYKLVFGDKGNGTWSQKYNIVWDKILDMNVFPPEVIQKEMAFYKTKMNAFGVPLDSRKSYTKLDWEYWTATMGSDEDFKAISDACANYANTTPARVPLSDWYETDTAKKSGFQARSVVGGVFIGLMRDKAIWKKYAKRDETKIEEWAPIPWQKPPMKKLVAAADTEPATWKYTFDKPAEGWSDKDFDDKSWKAGKSGFGTRGTPGAMLHTTWDTPDIWMRRDFTMPAGALNDPQLFVHHDDDVEIYLNGVRATRANNFVATYGTMPISKAARETLKPGKNTLAVHCRQDHGGQYIDVGLVDLMPMPKP